MKKLVNTIAPEAKKFMEERGMDYVTTIPAVIPEGKVLVHNSVRPARRIGWRGSRVWLEPLSPGLEPCPCGWAPEHPQHYRVIRSDAA